MTQVVFHLYVAGVTSHGQQIFQIYDEACRQRFTEGSYRIELIDILKQPELAERDKVLATPTICRIDPAPEKRIIGKVNSEQAVVAIQFLTEDLSNL